MLAALLIAPALIGYAQQAPPGASQPDEGLAGALSERGIPGSIIAGLLQQATSFAYTSSIRFPPPR